MREWIEWKGGECPVGGNVLVCVRLKGGETVYDRRADSLCWFNRRHKDDVATYRLSAQRTMEEDYEQAHKEIGDSALDVQVGGDHYKQYKIQPVEYIHANKIPFIEGNVIKYVTRWRSKGGIADLRKAIHKLELLIELEGK